MSTATPPRIDLSTQILQEVQQLTVSPEDTLLLRSKEGALVELSPRLQQIVFAALASLASDGEVTVGRVPDQLTSTVAANMLGVSRPTLLKWSREGLIDSVKVGSHTRFRRDDVLELRDERERKRRQAFDELRSLDAEEG